MGITKAAAVGQVVGVANGEGIRRTTQQDFESWVRLAAAVPVPPAGEPQPAPDPPRPVTEESSQDELLDTITKLGQLREAGLLTDEEFQSKKAELLGRL